MRSTSFVSCCLTACRSYRAPLVFPPPALILFMRYSHSLVFPPPALVLFVRYLLPTVVYHGANTKNIDDDDQLQLGDDRNKCNRRPQRQLQTAMTTTNHQQRRQQQQRFFSRTNTYQNLQKQPARAVASTQLDGGEVATGAARRRWRRVHRHRAQVKTLTLRTRCCTVPLKYLLVQPSAPQLARS